MHALALFALSLPIGALAACGGASITNCGDEPDVSGGWTLQLSPSALDAGTATIPSELTLDAELAQAGKTDFLGLGHYVYGTLSSTDPTYFGDLTIPRLTMNDGSKTGAILGCTLRINIPVAAPVSDDNVDQGPLRLALAGQVTMKGVLTGVDSSTLIMSSDANATVRSFTWHGQRH
jgi:hypothetical protein